MSAAQASNSSAAWLLYPAWKDVVTVSPGETVRIRMPFRDYTGKMVYHCHVLDYEDRGMMGTLEIQQA